MATRHRKYDFTGCDPMGDLPIDYELELLKLCSAGMSVFVLYYKNEFGAH